MIDMQDISTTRRTLDEWEIHLHELGDVPIVAMRLVTDPIRGVLHLRRVTLHSELYCSSTRSSNRRSASCPSRQTGYSLEFVKHVLRNIFKVSPNGETILYYWGRYMPLSMVI